MSDPEATEIDLAKTLGVNAAISVQQITLYIPDADRNGKRVNSHQAWVRRAAKLLAKMGRGYTISPVVEGGWLSDTDELVIDRPTLLYSYLQEGFVQHLPDLRTFLHDLGRETNQGQVAFTLDNVFYRITVFDRR